MRNSVTQRLPDAPRKNLAARMLLGESAHKPLANHPDDLARRVIGAVIDAALRGAGITKQEASHAMGYGQNQAPISNWISGKENPQLSRLWNIGREFRTHLVMGLAQACEDIEIKTVITVNRKASA
jgi:hypothetical protein